MNIYESRQEKDVKSDDRSAYQKKFEDKNILFSDILKNKTVCTNKKCAWNLDEYCKLPDLCPGRNNN